MPPMFACWPRRGKGSEGAARLHVEVCFPCTLPLEDKLVPLARATAGLLLMHLPRHSRWCACLLDGQVRAAEGVGTADVLAEQPSL